MKDAPAAWRHLAWAMGVCLACHCTAFISVSYFDQIQVYWFWLLAALASLPEQSARRAEAQQEEEAGESVDENYAGVVPEGGLIISQPDADCFVQVAGDKNL